MIEIWFHDKNKMVIRKSKIYYHVTGKWTESIGPGHLFS